MDLMRLLDLTGQRFGQLVVQSRADNRGGKPTWHCQCTCGGTKIVPSKNLRVGDTESCGCLHKAQLRARLTTHGMTPRGVPIRSEYSIWASMKDRCLNPRYHKWKDYGGRGISVAPEWLHDFAAFYKHIGPRPSTDYSIDRINNDGDYAPGNVRWATRKQQAANKRKPVARTKRT